MRLVVFGLTVSSSWGNGHATLWRGLIRALGRLGWTVQFFERDQGWYAEHRDLHDLAALAPGSELVLYPNWRSVLPRALAAVREAEAVMVTSYCPDGAAAASLLQDAAGGTTVFYDMDTPVTLARLAAGEPVDYLPPEGLNGFDLTLSYTGGAALTALHERLGAGRTAPLYGHVDPDTHHPVAPQPHYDADLSYLGTYAADRQAALQALFVDAAAARPQRRFVLAGANYPQDFPWTDNTWFVQHLPPDEHRAFFSSSALTLNVTRADMAAMGWCPSGRLFEAAACGCPVLSDRWEGLDAFYTPGAELLTAATTADALAALDLGRGELARIGAAARERTLDEHTSLHRARELLRLLERPAATAVDAAPAQAEV